MLAGIGAFEYVFFVMGHRWAYPGNAEMVTAVAESYRAALPPGSTLVTDCDACLRNLAAHADASPTLQRLRAADGTAGAAGSVPATPEALAQRWLRPRDDRPSSPALAVYDRALIACDIGCGHSIIPKVPCGLYFFCGKRLCT